MELLSKSNAVSEVDSLNKNQLNFQRPSMARPEKFNSGNLQQKISIALYNARLLMQNGEIVLAANLIRAVLNWDSKNLKAVTMLCDCLRKQEKYEELAKVLTAITKYHTNFDLIFDLANTNYLLGNDDEALRAYFECLALMESNSTKLFEIYKNLGNIFVRQRDFEGAEEYYNRAHALDRSNDIIFVNFGTLEIQRGNFDKALDCFRQAINLNSGSDRAWIGLALVHDYYGDHDLAWGNIERALDINKLNITALQLYGTWGLKREKTIPPSERILEVITVIEPNPTLSLLLIQLLIHNKDYERAQLELERAFLFDPYDSNLQKLVNHIRQNQSNSTNLNEDRTSFENERS